MHRFFDALNIASRTGDTTAVRAMITPTCCSELIKAIAHDFAGGRHAENGVWTVSAVSIFGQDGPRFYVDATWSLSALRVISANGSVEGSYPARSTRGQLVVARSGDGWVIEHMERFTTGNTQAQR